MKPSATAFFHILQRRYVYQMNCLLARSCVVCESVSTDVVCSLCWKNLKKPKYLCRVCGIALPAETQSHRCQVCIKMPPYYDGLAYAANYESVLADWIVAAKIGRKADAIEAIKQLVMKEFERDVFSEYEGFTLLAMPISRFRLMQRGFNFPLLVAKQIAHLTGLPIVPSCVVLLPLMTKKQTRLSKKQREEHKEVICIAGDLPSKLLIVDDVVTTGTTINNLSKALRKNGVKQLSVWALARSQ